VRRQTYGYLPSHKASPREYFGLGLPKEPLVLLVQDTLQAGSIRRQSSEGIISVVSRSTVYYLSDVILSILNIGFCNFTGS